MTTTGQTLNERLIQLMGEIDEVKRQIETSRVRASHYVSFNGETHDFKDLSDDTDIDFLNLKANKIIKRLEAKLEKLRSKYNTISPPSEMVISLIERKLDPEDIEKIRKIATEAAELSATIDEAARY